MVHRTRACRTCRQKRIKCDATTPHCAQCTRAGRSCPGPIQGPLIVDVTLATERRARTKENLRRNAEVIHMAPPNCIGIPYLPSESSIAAEAFFAKFLYYFTSSDQGGSRRTWMHVLPELSDNRNEALGLAVQATTTAFCGMELANPAVLRKACQLYGKALAAHSSSLTKERSNTSTPDIALICTSVMLSLYESMDGASSAGFISHITGSAKLVELAMLSCHSPTLLKEVFYYVRFHQAFLSLLGCSQPSPSPDPLLRLDLSNKIPTVQRLLTLATILLTFYPSAPTRQIPDPTTISQISNAIDALWLEYTTQSAALSATPMTWNESSSVYYRDAMTALAFMYFNAVHILLALASTLSQDKLDARSTTDLIDYHARILDAAAFLYQKRIGCAYNRMSLPLYLVAVHGPLAVQRGCARRYFEQWRRGGTMAGISKLALERIEAVEVELSYYDCCGPGVGLPVRIGVAA